MNYRHKARKHSTRQFRRRALQFEVPPSWGDSTSLQTNKAFVFKVSSPRNTMSLKVFDGIWKTCNFNEQNFSKQIAKSLHMKWPENVIKRQTQDISHGFLYRDATEKSHFHILKYPWIKCSEAFQKPCLGKLKQLEYMLKYSYSFWTRRSIFSTYNVIGYW